VIKFFDHFKKNQPLKRSYKGTVVDNNDPMRLARVKVKIEELFTDEYLPWVYPKQASGLGGRVNSNTFVVPDIGTEVVVEFPNLDPYSGFYTAVWQSEKTHQGDFNEDYPDSFGFSDSSGAYAKINRKKQLVEFVTPAGDSISSEKGEVKFRFKKSLRIFSDDGHIEIFMDMETGTVTIKGREGIQLSSPTLNLENSSISVSTNSMKCEVSGGYEEMVGGGKKELIGGSLSEAVLDSKAESVGGDVSTMIAGKKSEVIGTGVSETIVSGGIETEVMLGDEKHTVTAGSYEVNALVGNYKVTAMKISLGNGVIELLAKIIDLIDKLGMCTPLSPVGPCAPMNSSPQWPMVEMVKTEINTIKS